MNKGKLEPKVRKCIFLGYGEGVRKRVYVVSPYSKSFSFLISTNVTLDEAIMMNPRKKPFDTKKTTSMWERKVELKPKAWGTIGKNLVMANEEDVQHRDNKENA